MKPRVFHPDLGSRDFVERLKRYLAFRWVYLIVLATVGITTQVLADNPGRDINRDLLVAIRGLLVTGAAHLAVFYSKHKSNNFYYGIGWLLLVSDVALAASLIFNRGGVESRSIILYAIPIVIAAGLFGRLATYFIAGLCAISYNLIIGLEWFGLVQTRNILFPSLHQNSGYAITSAVFYTLVMFLIASVGDFVGRILAHEQRSLKRNQEYLELQRMVAVSANEAESVEEAMKIAVDLFCIYTRSPLGHAFSVDSTQTRLVPLKVWYIGDWGKYEALQEVSDKMELAKGQGVPGKSWESKGPVWFNDLAKDKTLPRREVFEKLELSGGLAFPITVKNEVVAILEFFSKKPIEKSSDIDALIKYINAQMGQVFVRRKNEEAIRARTLELEKFNKIMLGREVRMAELKRQLSHGEKNETK